MWPAFHVAHMFDVYIQAVCSSFLRLIPACALCEIRYYQSAVMDESMLIPQTCFQRVVHKIAADVKDEFEFAFQGWAQVTVVGLVNIDGRRTP